jgi:ATP-binding cassette, subfamily A (ABC1), member 3
LFLVYGLAYIPFSYIASFVFKDYGNAQAVFYFFTFVIGGLVSTVILVLRMLGGQISVVGGYIGWALRIFPSYCFG